MGINRLVRWFQKVGVATFLNTPAFDLYLVSGTVGKEFADEMIPKLPIVAFWPFHNINPPIRQQRVDNAKVSAGARSHVYLGINDPGFVAYR